MKAFDQFCTALPQDDLQVRLDAILQGDQPFDDDAVSFAAVFLALRSEVTGTLPAGSHPDLLAQAADFGDELLTYQMGADEEALSIRRPLVHEFVDALKDTPSESVGGLVRRLLNCCPTPTWRDCSDPRLAGQPPSTPILTSSLPRLATAATTGLGKAPAPTRPCSERPPARPQDVGDRPTSCYRTVSTATVLTNRAATAPESGLEERWWFAQSLRPTSSSDADSHLGHLRSHGLAQLPRPFRLARLTSTRHERHPTTACSPHRQQVPVPAAFPPKDLANLQHGQTSRNLRSHEIAPRPRPRRHSVLTGRWSPSSTSSLTGATS